MKRRNFSIGDIACGACLCLGLGLSALLISGCDEIDQMADNAGKRPVTQNFTPGIETDPEAREHKPATPPPAAPQNPATPDANATAAQPAQPQPAQPQPAPQTPPPETAQGNMGVQGQGYGGGMITEPVHQYFGMRQQITWDQLKHQTDLWQAEHGRFPKDDKEYQKEIVDACGVELPELPPNRKYVYDPKTGELLVGWVTPAK